MNILPDSFPTDSLSAINKIKLNTFYQEFVENFYDEYTFGHFILATYAAIPSLLTPDLLYKIWMNFNKYQWGKNKLTIHRIAISDILLSPLVREVGFELYEMNEEIRTAFRQWLTDIPNDEEWKNQGFATIDTLANFLLYYHQEDNPGSNRWGQGYEEIQEWTALAYLEPERAKAKILNQLNFNIQNNRKHQVLRILNIFPKIADQIAVSNPEQKTANQQNLKEIALFTKAWKALLEDNTDFFQQTFQEHPSLKKYLNDEPEGGIEVKILKELEATINPIPETPKAVSTLHAFLIGIDQYHPDSGISDLRGCVNDVNAFRTFLQANYTHANPAITVLLNQEATRENILQQFEDQIIDKAESGHTVLIYYAGYGSFASTAVEFTNFDSSGIDETLVGYDSRLEGKYDIADKELAVLFARIEKGTQMVFIVDSCYATSVTRNEGNQFDLGKKRFLKEREDNRPLETYLNGFYSRQLNTKVGINIPISNRILFTACNQQDEGAWETNERRGLFTSSLLEVLSKTKLSYVQSLEITRIKMKDYGVVQTPSLSVFGYFDTNQIFLSNTKKANLEKYPILFINGQWHLECGAIHGFPTMPETWRNLNIGIYDEQETLIQQTKIKQLHLKESILEFSEGEPDKIYFGVILNRSNAFLINLKGDPIQKQAFLELFAQAPSNSIQFVEEGDYGAFSLKIQEEELLVYETKSDRLLHKERDINPNTITSITRVLESIAEWQQLTALENEQTRFQEAIDVKFIAEINPEEIREFHTNQITLDFPPTRGDEEDAPIFYSIELKNNAKQNLYVSLLHLSHTYGVSNFYPCTVIYPNTDWQVLDNERGLIIEEGNQVTDIFKIIISTESFEDYEFKVEAFREGGNVNRSTAITRDVTKRRQIEEADWFTKTIEVNSIKTANAIGKREQHFEKQGLSISGHPNLKATVAFSTAIQTYRKSLNRLDLKSIFKQKDIEILNFEDTSSSQNQIFIELSNIQNQASLKQNPLEIRIDQPISNSETLIPVSSNGEFFLPFGELRSINEDGSSVIHISDLPIYEDFTRTAIGESTVNSASFFLLKVKKHQQEGFLLREVIYKEGIVERIPFDRNKITNESNVLVVLHGLFGDTLPIIKNLDFLLYQQHYDCILCFDYENANTLLEEVAENLKKQLLSHDLFTEKGFDILAHSTGGLVSRYFIENLEREKVVKRLFLFGTPNRGSGEIPDEKIAALKLLTIALNFNKDWISALSTYFANLVHVLIGAKRINIVNSQLSKQSSFLAKLAKNNAPITEYFVIAGDITAFTSFEDQFFIRLMEIVIKDTVGEANDILYNASSMIDFPPSFKIQQTPIICHHLNYFGEDGFQILKNIFTTFSEEERNQLKGEQSENYSSSKVKLDTPQINEKSLSEETNQSKTASLGKEELKKTLRKLQVTGKIKEAYELLLENLRDDSTHTTTVYLRLADYNGLQNDIANGIAMNVQQRKAQINHALDYIIQNLEEEDLVS